MRGLLLATLLTLTVLSGCFGGDKDPQASPANALTADAIRLPAGSVLEAIEGGFAAVWDDVELPLVADITLPVGATMVRAVTTEGGTRFPW